jgi:hypothetical protein
VRKNSLGHVDAQTTKEEEAEGKNLLGPGYAKGQDDSQERNPRYVCPERRQLECDH